MEVFDLPDLVIGHEMVYRIPVVDQATRLPKAMTGIALLFTLRATPTGSAVISKTTGAGGITLVDLTPGDGVVDDGVDVTIARADTYTALSSTIVVPAGSYYWGLSDSSNWKPIAMGTVKAVLSASR